MRWKMGDNFDSDKKKIRKNKKSREKDENTKR